MFDKPKFIADESLGAPTVALIKGLGFPIVTVKEVNLGGRSDEEILEWAVRKGCVVVTEDLDFGNILAFPTALHCGVVLLRFRHREEEEIHGVLTDLLKELGPDAFAKTLIVVDADKYRIRRE